MTIIATIMNTASGKKYCSDIDTGVSAAGLVVDAGVSWTLKYAVEDELP